jgi:hypothetical protein
VGALKLASFRHLRTIQGPAFFFSPFVPSLMKKTLCKILGYDEIMKMTIMTMTTLTIVKLDNRTRVQEQCRKKPRRCSAGEAGRFHGFQPRYFFSPVIVKGHKKTTPAIDEARLMETILEICSRIQYSLARTGTRFRYE